MKIGKGIRVLVRNGADFHYESICQKKEEVSKSESKLLGTHVKSVEQVDWREEEVVVESLLQKLWEGTAYRNTETYLTEADTS